MTHLDAGSPPQTAIDRAIAEAKQSPCRKSKRGCAMFYYRGQAVVLNGQGHNGPPGSYECEGNAECRILCGRLCVHAEVRAILDGIKLNHAAMVAGIELVHVKVVDGELVAGGPPSCWSCATLVLETNVWAVWLYEDLHEGPRWTRWLAPQFYRSTMKRQKEHPDYQPRAGIECPCESISCRAQDGAKRSAKGAWHCIKCGHGAAP